MKNSFLQSMAWLHTWAGLLVGWLLFVIFVGGTLAWFDREIDDCARPALHEMRETPPTRFDDAFVEAFEAAAEENDARSRRPLARHGLTELPPARGEIDERAVVAGNGVDRGGRDIGADHHAGAAAGGRVIDVLVRP